MAVPSITEVITGKNVAVNGIAQVSQIKVFREVTAEPIFHSATRGGADRASGNVDFTGFYRAWGHTPPVFPNDSFALSFSLQGSGGGLTCADVLCTGIEIVVPTYDPNQQNGVYYTVYFGARGTDFSAGAAYSDASTAAILSCKGLACTFNSADQQNTQRMRLLIRSLTQRQLTSETTGVYIRPVANIDWEFEYRRAVNSMAVTPALPVPNTTTGALVMEVTAAANWTLNYGRCLSVDGVYDHESNDLIAVDVKIGMYDSPNALATITDPASAVQWP